MILYDRYEVENAGGRKPLGSEAQTLRLRLGGVFSFLLRSHGVKRNCSA